MMDLNQAQTALAELVSGNYTLDDLKDLAAQIDMDNAKGNITVLYSGKVNSISTTDIAEQMADDPNLRVINKTDAADFLESREFKEAVAAKFDGLDGLSAIELDQLDRNHPFNQWFFEPKTGIWADTSKRFVEATTGEVRILVETPDATRTLYQVELPELINRLEAGEITKIDGFTAEK